MPLSNESLLVLSAMEDLDKFCSAISELWDLEDFEIAQYIMIKDNWNLIKSACVHPHDEMRRIAILGFGKLMLKSWAILHELFEIDFLSKQSSLAETRRYKEDFADFGVELCVLISSHILGVFIGVDALQPTLTLTLGCFDACCEVIQDLLSSTIGHCSVQRWSSYFEGDGGLGGDGALHGRQCSEYWRQLNCASVSVLLGNFGQLVSNHIRWPESQHCTRLISSLLIFILRELPEQQSSNVVSYDNLQSSSRSMFAMQSSTDETEYSRCNALPLNVIMLGEEWISNRLSKDWEAESSCAAEECLASVWEALTLTQFATLKHLRIQVLI